MSRNPCTRIHSDTTSANLFLGGYQKAHQPVGKMRNDYAEAKGDEIIESAATHAEAVWAKPIGTIEAAIERAKAASFYNAEHVGEDGSPCFADHKHLDARERANVD